MIDEKKLADLFSRMLRHVHEHYVKSCKEIDELAFKNRNHPGTSVICQEKMTVLSERYKHECDAIRIIWDIIYNHKRDLCPDAFDFLKDKHDSLS